MFARLGQLLCTLGLHALEKEPSYKEPIKATGEYVGFMTEYVQRGAKKCLRSECGYSLAVWKIGWAGSKYNSKWMRLYDNNKEYINSLPNT